MYLGTVHGIMPGGGGSLAPTLHWSRVNSRALDPSLVLLHCASRSYMVSHECPKLRIRELRGSPASLHLPQLVKAS